MSALAGVLRRAGIRSRSSFGDRAFAAYAALLVGLVVVAPMLRAMWLLLQEPGVRTAVLGVPFSGMLAAVLAALASALLVGTTWGPAAHTPWLTGVLAESPFGRVRAFGGPVALLTGLSAALFGTLATLTATALASDLSLDVLVTSGVAVFFLGAALPPMALLGQRLGRTGRFWAICAFAIALTLLFIPSGPALVANASLTVAVVCGAVFLVLAALSPALLRGLTSTQLTRAAVQGEVAREGLTALDLARVSDNARPVPYLGRRWRAVRTSLPRPLMFLRSGAMSAARTPDRAILAVVGIAGAGILLVAGGPVAVAIATGALFVSLGALSDGIRHAAGPASLRYGIARWYQLLLHLALPTLICVALVAVVWVVGGGSAALVAGAACVLALGLRVSDAAKGQLPIELLAPVPTPVGDMGALFRLVWAIDAIALAIIGGYSIGGGALVWVGGVVAIVAWVAISRWRRDF